MDFELFAIEEAPPFYLRGKTSSVISVGVFDSVASSLKIVASSEKTAEESDRDSVGT